MAETRRRGAFNGPLRTHPVNPRYFTDDGGRAIYMTGSHTWENLQDQIFGKKTGFDYDGYIEFLEHQNHNFMRMWIWENASWMAGTDDKIEIAPIPYVRTGPGDALDGKPRFDLNIWNEEFFRRLRARVAAAGERGIYVSIMLFEGWSIRKPWAPGDPWKGHPFHRENNVNGLDGDNDADGVADIHCLEIPAVVEYQEAFVRKVVDTVNDLDNVLYEIINEAPGDDRTVDWQVYMVDCVHNYESTKPKQHPVGMTPSGNLLERAVLFTGRADWISPTYVFEPAYRTDPPAADGTKIILNDTDHLEPQLAIDYKWVWASFLRGLHPIFMDPWDVPEFIGADTSTPEFQGRIGLVRKNMGYTLKYANRIDLARTTPRGDLASSRYCLADPGREYLIFVPDGGTVEVDLTDAAGSLRTEWFDPVKGEERMSDPVSGGSRISLRVPFDDCGVLYICGE